MSRTATGSGVVGLEEWLNTTSTSRTCRACSSPLRDQVDKAIFDLKAKGEPIPYKAICDWLATAGESVSRDVLYSHVSRGHYER